MNIILTAVSVATLVLCAILLTVKSNEDESPFDWKTFIIVLSASFLVVIVSSSVYIIPSGYTGVKTTLGQIDSTPVPNGLGWKIPFFQYVDKVNNKQQNMNFKDKVWSETNTRTAIYYEDVTVTFQIDSSKSAWILANVSDWENSLITQNIVSSAIKSASKSLNDTDATNRSLIEPLILDSLQKILDEKYEGRVVYINEIIVGNADFEDSYNEAIAAKQKAQLLSEQQEIENKKAIAKAEADAVVSKTKADADANVKLIAAKAESEANALLEQSLTDKVLRQMFIEKWNGELPRYSSSDLTGMMLLDKEQ